MRTILLTLLGWLAVALVAAKVAHLVTGGPQPWVYLPFLVAAAVTAIWQKTRASR